MKMINDDLNDSIQVFPLKEGGCNLSAGTYAGIRLIHCVADGEIKITWHSGATISVQLIAGDDFGVECSSIELVSGTFHLA